MNLNTALVRRLLVYDLHTISSGKKIKLKSIATNFISKAQRILKISLKISEPRPIVSNFLFARKRWYLPSGLLGIEQNLLVADWAKL